MKKRYILILLIAFFGIMFWLLLKDAKAPAPVPASTEQNLTPDTNNPVDIQADDGIHARKDDMIVVASPSIGAAVSSPLVVKGYARGNWYFEGSFPVVLTDWQDNVLAQGVAKAQGDWMTNGYVPFVASLSYTLPANIGNKTGLLVLKKDNPSGDPKLDNQLEINVQFK